MVVGIGSCSSFTEEKRESEDLENGTPSSNKKDCAQMKTNPTLSSAQVISQRITVGCKILAFLIVVVATVAHAVRIHMHKGDTCSYLFSQGQWVEQKFWQPYGCMMHHYMPSEIRTCIRNNKVAIVGDSRMRALYYRLSGELSPKPLPTKKHHADMSFNQPSNISVNFYWQPEVNESMQKLFKNWLAHPSQRPQLIIAGAGSWTIKTKPLKNLLMYHTNMDSLRAIMTQLINEIKKSHVQDIQHPKLDVVPQIIWVVQDPVVENKLSEARKVITNEKLETFNSFAEEALKNSPVKFLNSSHLMAAGRPDQTHDGLHYDTAVINVQLDAILNSFCNSYMVPSDASCCSVRERHTHLQYNAIAFFTTCVVLCLVMMCGRRCKKGIDDTSEKNESIQAGLAWIRSEKMYPVMKSMAKLGVIMIYFFVCDRDFLFMKAHKNYNPLAVIISLVVFLVFGIYSTKPVKQSHVLNGEQLEEWKGWMILLIMLYEYIGVETILPLYVCYRLLIASFLFMTGFGHFRYFWVKGDFRLYRVCKIMARMNVFAVVVCLVMDRPYQFYYFIPLVSFWYIFIYCTFAIPPTLTAKTIAEHPMRYAWVAVSFGILFAVIFVIWGNETVCDWLFSRWPIKELFVNETGSVHEWTVQSGRDRYIAIFGMLFAFVYLTCKKCKLFDDEENKGALFYTKTSILALLIALLGFVSYGIQALTCSTRFSCDFTHAIASCIPITSFVFFRNIPGYFRSRYSAFFAWVGKISLEIFVAKCHIWLVSDSNGVLVLIPNEPTINALVTSFVFICIVHELTTITNTLSDALVTKDVKVMLRRLLVFILMLIIIWYHKTHEKKPIPS